MKSWLNKLKSGQFYGRQVIPDSDGDGDGDGDDDELGAVDGEPRAPLTPTTTTPTKEGHSRLTLQQVQGPPRSSSRVEVILDPSPRPTSRHLDDGGGGGGDDDIIRVTSDIGPQVARQRQKAITSAGVVEPVITVDLGAAVAPPQHAETTPPKPRRGRPKGSRNKVHTSSSVGRPPGSAKQKQSVAATRPDRNKEKEAPNYALKRKRGRPPKAARPSQHLIFTRLDPHFIAFRCAWDGCRAELHNMETLRRHVRVVHGASRECRWASCAAAGVEDHDPKPKHLFHTEADFVDHMETKHLVPYQWYMGDGYRNTVTVPARDEDPGTLPSYLFDKDGKQVTPSIRTQEEEDFATYRANRQRLRELLMLRDANAPFEDEDEGDPASD